MFVPLPICANALAGALGRYFRSVLRNQFMKPYVGCAAVGVRAQSTHCRESICRSFHLPWRKREVTEARHVVGVDEHAPAPMPAAASPTEPQCHRERSTNSRSRTSARCSRRRWDPSRSLFSTCGSGRRQTLSAASASTLTRVSLYFQARAGLVARPRGPLTRLVAGPVGPVGLAPERAFPVAGLAQQVVPRDGPVVRRFERDTENPACRGCRICCRPEPRCRPESAEHTRAPCR